MISPLFMYIYIPISGNSCSLTLLQPILEFLANMAMAEWPNGMTSLLFYCLPLHHTYCPVMPFAMMSLHAICLLANHSEINCNWKQCTGQVANLPTFKLTGHGQFQSGKHATIDLVSLCYRLYLHQLNNLRASHNQKISP